MDDNSNQPILSHAQLRAARAWLGWKQVEVAQRSGLGIQSIKNLEAGKNGPRQATSDKLRRVFEDAGLTFEGGGISPV